MFARAMENCSADEGQQSRKPRRPNQSRHSALPLGRQVCQAGRPRRASMALGAAATASADAGQAPKAARLAPALIAACMGWLPSTASSTKDAFRTAANG